MYIYTCTNGKKYSINEASALTVKLQVSIGPSCSLALVTQWHTVSIESIVDTKNNIYSV